MKYNLILTLLLLAIFSCDIPYRNNNDSSNISDELKRKELELKERELTLKEKEFELLEKINSNNDEKDLTTLYKELKKSIFLIYTVDDEENISQGTAFTIDKTGIAISNYHVFANASEAIAINEYGDEFVINEIISFDEESDYFAFRLGPNNNEFDYLELATTLPEIGEDCFAIGNPKGLKNTISKGIVSSFRENGNIIQTDAAFTHGSSGGPLFNKNGEVIGITSSGFEGEDLNFAIYINSIPIKDLKKLSLETAAIISESNIETFSAKDYITKYFNFLENQQFVQATNMFSENIKRYYHKFNPTTEWIYKDMSSYREKSKISSVSIEVDYNTIETYESANGTYLIDFYMDYKILRMEKNKPSKFRLKLFMEVSNNNKIVSIYEDIISKK